MLSWYNFRSIRSLSHNLLCPLSDLDRSACRPVPIFRCLHQLSVVRPSRFPICVRPAAAWTDIHLRSFGRERGKVEILAPVLSLLLCSAPISPLGISRSVISRRRGGGATESKSEITQLAFISTRLIFGGIEWMDSLTVSRARSLGSSYRTGHNWILSFLHC